MLVERYVINSKLIIKKKKFVEGIPTHCYKCTFMSRFRCDSEVSLRFQLYDLSKKVYLIREIE